MKSKIMSLLILIVFCAACPAPCEVEETEITAIYTEAAPIVRALENFRAERNVYPASLNELVPKYLVQIPATVGGRKFQYQKRTEKEFALEISSRSGGFYSGSCTYTQIESEWKRAKGAN